MKLKPYPPYKIYPVNAFICYLEEPKVTPESINLLLRTFKNFKTPDP